MKKVNMGQYVLLAFLTLFAIMCLLPILLVLIVSFTDQAALAANGFSFFPEKWSLESWQYLGKMKNQLITSYGVTIFTTVVGTLGTLLVESMFAYTLCRRNFVLRNGLSIMLLITMLFSGGQLSSYMINSNVYHLKDNLLLLYKPIVGVMHVIMMRAYIQNNISDALIESGKIDGAGEFRIYVQICMPLMPPVLASLGFMIAVGYWNEWQTALLYITSPDKVPLQLLLMRIEKNIEFMANNADLDPQALAEMARSIPTVGVRMAILFTVLGPIMIAYPFFQKYFIKGLTVGAVKG